MVGVHEFILTAGDHREPSCKLEFIVDTLIRRLSCLFWGLATTEYVILYGKEYRLGSVAFLPLVRTEYDGYIYIEMI